MHISMVANNILQQPALEALATRLAPGVNMETVEAG